ncbi:DUF1080 domain-containing protein [Parapedobacter sp. DT-150]|uniref:DUF1080 domain-containing protein n=1 Tax=Parapedobacter sp. DT-150 TaxID=3396162 RepID=UPI003F1D3145
MIKSIYTLLALFILQLPVSAQQGDTRTTTTKIADLLALLPAETPERFQDALGQLERFGATDISAMLQQLLPPGTGNNAGVEYAANSYSYYVLLSGKQGARATFIKGAVDALAAVANKDTKGFIIQMLQNAGDDTAVDALSPYLSDEYLSEKAARALARIGTTNAGEALLKALPNASGDAEIQIVNALGFMAYAPAEQSILAKANTEDIASRRTILYALSRIGGNAAGQTLASAAADAGYVYEPTEATAAYINYLHRLIANDETARAKKMATKLFKATNQAEQVHTHVAALGLLTDINAGKQVKTLVKASKDTDGKYRNAALRLLTPYLNDRVSAQLVKRLSRADEQAQADILRYVGDHNQAVALPEVKDAWHAESAGVRVAAVEASHKLMGDAAAEELIGLLAENDTITREAIKQVLLISKNEQLPQLVSTALSKEKDAEVQLLLIDVLAQRGASESVPIMLEIIRGDAPKTVKDAAYAALPQVVRPDDLEKILDLLPDAEAEYATFIQDAAVASISRSDDPGAQTQQVISRIQGADASRRTLFFPILAGVGGQEALAVVSGYTDQGEPALRAAATAALANWTSAEALPELVALSRKQTVDAAALDAVIKGLVRIVGAADIPAEQKVLYLRDAFEVAGTAAQKQLILRALEANKTYNALLFAGRFLDDEQLKSTAANTVMNIALDSKQFYGAAVENLLKKVITLLSGSESSYLREAVQKHINELPKGAGYAPLFNGHDLEGWKGLVADPIKRAKMSAKTLAEAQVKADETMRLGWYVKDGALHFNGKGDNIATVKQYGDFELLVDWKLAKEGKEGDAGIYLRGTPQVQIWDTSRVNVGAQVGSGGLYNNQQHESKPLKVADNPLGEWNTFRITMVGDRVTVYLNGELVTDSVVLENYWDRNLPIFPTEQLELQAHGTHVSYRDIYVRELPRKEVFTLPETEKQAGFEVLFDGTNLDAWTGSTTAYQVSEEGTLAIYPTEGSGGNFYTKEEFADFVYRFEFRLTPGANNGIGIRAPAEGDAAYAGMEIQVLDDGADMYKDLAQYQYHGSVYGIIPAKRGYLRPVGEWNEEEIYIKGNKIRVTLNGTVIVDGDLAEATKNGPLDHKDHPGLKRKSGHIAFLGHGSEVHFRNIRVKRL